MASIARPTRYLNALVLVPHLDTTQHTFEELWRVAAAHRPDHSCGLKPDSDHLRLRRGITHRPGLRWEVVSLGANPGIAPAKVPTDLVAHAGVLAAAAHFPAWVRAMDGVTVPYAWIAGYQCSDQIRAPWRAVPYVLLSDYPQSTVYLATGADDDQGGGCMSVPVRWER